MSADRNRNKQGEGQTGGSSDDPEFEGGTSSERNKQGGQQGGQQGGEGMGGQGGYGGQGNQGFQGGRSSSGAGQQGYPRDKEYKISDRGEEEENEEERKGRE